MHRAHRNVAGAALGRLHLPLAASPKGCRRATSTAASAAANGNPHWTGSDAYTALGDRNDLPPLPLPPSTSAKRVVLVRHGQSTWNAAGVIQGSSDASVLTPKGQLQAATTRDMLGGASFDALFHSPLERARHTAQIVWDGRPGPVAVLPSLREIDLYDFQGLVKSEGKARYGAEYRRWQQYPHLFEVSGHAPVRELWYRASLAWHTLLTTPDSTRVLLVVAHNAINQALLGTALGLAPANFRRLVQSNGATTVVDFLPSGEPGQGHRVVLQHVNQEPTARRGKAGGKVKGAGQLLLLCCGRDGSAGLPASDGDSGSGGSWTQRALAFRAAEVLLDRELSGVSTSGSPPASAMADAVAGLWTEAHGGPAPKVSGLPALQDGDASSCWRQLVGSWREGDVQLLVASESQLRQLLAAALDLPAPAMQALRFEEGGLTVVELPSLQPSSPADEHLAPAGEVPVSAKAKLLHLNTTSHLGRWAPSIDDFADKLLVLTRSAG